MTHCSTWASGKMPAWKEKKHEDKSEEMRFFRAGPFSSVHAGPSHPSYALVDGSI